MRQREKATEPQGHTASRQQKQVLIRGCLTPGVESLNTLPKCTYIHILCHQQPSLYFFCLHKYFSVQFSILLIFLQYFYCLVRRNDSFLPLILIFYGKPQKFQPEEGMPKGSFSSLLQLSCPRVHCVRLKREGPLKRARM